MELLNQLYEFYRGVQFARIGDSVWILLMAAGCYVIYQGKNEVLKKAVIFPSVFYTIFVMNSYTMNLFYTKFGFESRAYRFLWMYPVLLIVGYVGVQLFDKIQSNRKRIFLGIFLVVITFFTINIDMETYRTENIYKVQNELLLTTELIHKDGAEEPWVFYEDENLYLTARQYDASIKIMYWQPVVSEPLNQAKQEEISWDTQEYHDWLVGQYLQYMVMNKDTTVLDGGQYFELVAETDKSKIYRVK